MAINTKIAGYFVFFILIVGGMYMLLGGEITFAPFGGMTTLALSNINYAVNDPETGFNQLFTAFITLNRGGQYLYGVDQDGSASSVFEDEGIEAQKTFYISGGVDYQKCKYGLNQIATFKSKEIEYVDFPSWIYGTVRGEDCTNIMLADWNVYRDRCENAGGKPVECDAWLGSGLHCVKLVDTSEYKAVVNSLSSPSIDWQATFKVGRQATGGENIILSNTNHVDMSANGKVLIKYTGDLASDNERCPSEASVYMINRYTSNVNRGEKVVTALQYDDLDDKHNALIGFSESDRLSGLENKLNLYNNQLFSFVQPYGGTWEGPSEDWEYGVEAGRGFVFLDRTLNGVSNPTFVLKVDAEWLGVVELVAIPEIQTITDRCSFTAGGNTIMHIPVKNTGTHAGPIDVSITCDNAMVEPSTQRIYPNSNEIVEASFIVRGIAGNAVCSVLAKSVNDPSKSDTASFGCEITEICDIVCEDPYTYHPNYPNVCECIFIGGCMVNEDCPTGYICVENECVLEEGEEEEDLFSQILAFLQTTEGMILAGLGIVLVVVLLWGGTSKGKPKRKIVYRYKKPKVRGKKK